MQRTRESRPSRGEDYVQAIDEVCICHWTVVQKVNKVWTVVLRHTTEGPLTFLLLL